MYVYVYTFRHLSYNLFTLRNPVISCNLNKVAYYYHFLTIVKLCLLAKKVTEEIFPSTVRYNSSYYKIFPVLWENYKTLQNKKITSGR